MFRNSFFTVVLVALCLAVSLPCGQVEARGRGRQRNAPQPVLLVAKGSAIDPEPLAKSGVDIFSCRFLVKGGAYLDELRFTYKSDVGSVGSHKPFFLLVDSELVGIYFARVVESQGVVLFPVFAPVESEHMEELYYLSNGQHEVLVKADMSFFQGMEGSFSTRLTCLVWRAVPDGPVLNAVLPGGWQTVRFRGAAKQAPLDWCLARNSPNPFNPATTIEYALPEAALVRLEIYNTLAQVVATLVEEEQGAGQYSVRWDGLNSYGEMVSSGVYLYRIVAGDFQATKRMLLIR